MSHPLTSLRRVGFWVSPVLLLGSLLLAWPLALMAAYFPPAIVLLLLPLGGLVLGVGLILGSAQPLWAKLLVLCSPVLLPLLLVVVVGELLPAGDHLTFLIPVGFRGEVAVVQQELPNILQAQVQGDITLTVPASGFVTTSAQLTSKMLGDAEYYFVSPSGERVEELPQLDELETNANVAGPAKRAAGQKVGIFTLGLHYKTILLGNDCPACPVQETPFLSFVVGRYDSLGSASYAKSPF